MEGDDRSPSLGPRVAYWGCRIHYSNNGSDNPLCLPPPCMAPYGSMLGGLAPHAWPFMGRGDDGSGVVAGPPSSATLRPPTLPPRVCSIGCQPLVAVRFPLSPNLSVIGCVRLGGVEGGIVLIRRGVTTTANPPHHCDTVSISLPCKDASRGGFTHDACIPVRVVGVDRVRGPSTHRQHPGKMLSMGSPFIGWSRRCVTSFMQ